MRIWIKRALVVNEGTRQELDLWIEHGRIVRLGTQLAVPHADVCIEARGRWCLPGLIDDQVHFREPGLTHKATLASESKAAVLGGVTSFMEMPNTHPTTTTHQAWRDKMQRAQRSAHANYAFFFGATNDNLETLRELDPTTTCGIKIFMGSSTGNMLVDNSDILEQIFASTPLLIATHCEDTPTIQNNFKRAQERYGVDIPIALHPHIRSEEACFLSSSRAVELAKKHGTRLHVLHISTARELSLFENRPLDQKHITAEACIHHMFFCDEDYARLGTQIKCNPAIKTKRDRDAILNAIRNDVIDVIATDHAPHTWEEKQAPYPSAPSGLPLIQHSLLSLLEHVQRQRLTLEQVVQKTSHRVADLFRIRDRGFIREGYWADLVLVDPNQTTTVTQENIAYACGWSPFLGHTFPASIDATIVSGALAYYEGKLQPKPRGQALTFHAEPGSA